jgi:hypothetical protein|nr:MAG TPA: Major capsid protein [Caudoviricetes sp.]
MANYVTPTKGTGAVDGTPATKPFVPQIWAPEVEKNRTDNLVLWNFIDHSNLGEAVNYGDMIHVPFMDEIDTDVNTNTTTDGTATAIDGIKTRYVDVLIDRYLRKPVGVQDVAKAQSKYEFRALYVERLGRWIAKAHDTEVISKIQAETQILKQTTAAAGQFSYNDIVDALGQLDAANVPEDNRALFVNGKVRAALRKIPEFTSYASVGEKGIVKTMHGLVGEVFGMPVYVTNVIKQKGNKDVAYIMHKSAVKGLAQFTKTEDGRDKIQGVDYVVGSTLFGAKVIRPDHVVEITVK